MQSADYRYHHDSEHLTDLKWEDTLLKHLRDTVETKRLVLKGRGDVVVFDGSPNDLPDELLLAECLGRDWYGHEYGIPCQTLALDTLYVDTDGVPSYWELANRCVEDEKRLSDAKKREKSAKKRTDENEEIIRGLLKLALRKGWELDVHAFVHEMAFVLDIELDRHDHEEDYED